MRFVWSFLVARKRGRMRTREQHLEWCKIRAREYLQHGDVMNAVTSMVSDLAKHPETTTEGNTFIFMLAMIAASSGSIEEARRFIEGFR